jgi:DNA-directed RNA polymerase subunit RPC12/RpoP
MYETWETKCPKCGRIFGGRISQLNLPKNMTLTCPNCSINFIPDIVSPAGLIEDKQSLEATPDTPSINQNKTARKPIKKLKKSNDNSKESQEILAQIVDFYS